MLGPLVIFLLDVNILKVSTPLIFETLFALCPSYLYDAPEKCFKAA